jgi:hypothetical protein
LATTTATTNKKITKIRNGIMCEMRKRKTSQSFIEQHEKGKEEEDFSSILQFLFGFDDYNNNEKDHSNKCYQCYHIATNNNFQKREERTNNK